MFEPSTPTTSDPVPVAGERLNMFMMARKGHRSVRLCGPFCQKGPWQTHAPTMLELIGWKMPSVGEALWSLLPKGTTDHRI